MLRARRARPRAETTPILVVMGGMGARRGVASGVAGADGRLGVIAGRTLGVIAGVWFILSLRWTFRGCGGSVLLLLASRKATRS